ncbi:MAG: NADH-quinone oxidoreductase subunit J [Thermoguttaceae bacterium]|jgi:NADH-quinone oxidoreductase subunit J
MISPRAILGLGTALVAVGIWWLLPGSSTQRRTLGGVLAVVGFGFLGSQVPAVGDWFTKGMFHAIAAGTIVAAVATISFRNPVYCAIWFGMTLTGTAGLFLLAGAEFLAVATLVVYAGAILVTFLFVLMLAAPEGDSSYDRHSWEAMISAFTGAVFVGILTMTIGSAITKVEATRVSAAGAAVTPAADGSEPATAHPAPYAISRLGAELFTRYLVAVEAAGALLFAALVGAAVIVTQGRAAMKRPAATRDGGTAHAS